MSSLYKCDADQEQHLVMEEFRNRISESGLGVTLNGNRLTIRGDINEQLCDMHMVILRIGVPSEMEQSIKGDRAREKYIENLTEKEKQKYWDYQAELYHNDMGYYPQ